MSDDLTGNVPFTRPAAPGKEVVGKRILAALIDIVVLIVIGVVFALLFGRHTTTGSAANGQVSSSASFSLSGAPAVIYFLVDLAYYGVSEALTGQTLGKALLGLRVVKLDGSPCTPGAALVRTLLRLIDGLPLFYLVGLICIAVSARAQRLGDMAAGTVVVGTHRG
jgi:uncharacterized RDD family membrane protein YckC